MQQTGTGDTGGEQQQLLHERVGPQDRRGDAGRPQVLLDAVVAARDGDGRVRFGGRGGHLDDVFDARRQRLIDGAELVLDLAGSVGHGEEDPARAAERRAQRVGVAGVGGHRLHEAAGGPVQAGEQAVRIPAQRPYRNAQAGQAVQGGTAGGAGRSHDDDHVVLLGCLGGG